MSGPSGVPWVVVPTFQERDNLERLVAAVREALAPVCPAGFRILVVDDDSPDGTGALADALAARFPEEVAVLHRHVREGLGAAYLAGFAHALAGGADHVLEMDADLSHDPRDLPRMLGEARAGADLVLGSRYVPGGGIVDWSRRRRALSAFGSWYARTVLAVPVRDLTGGFKCFDRRVLEAIELDTVRSVGYAFQVELTYRTLRAGFAVREVPIVFRDRVAGRSKMHPRIALEAAVLVPQLRRHPWHPGAPPVEPIIDAPPPEPGPDGS